MTTRNSRRRVDAAMRHTALLIASLLVVFLGPRALARQAAEPLPLEASLAAHKAVVGWVRQSAVPDGASEPGVKCPAAQVMILNGGEIIGRGVADGATPILTATREAIAQAAGRMPDARDLLQAQNALKAWALLSVSLEVAGPLIPISPRTYDDADSTCSPGVDGVGVRIGSKLEHVFPATSLVRSWRPGDALASAIAAASGDPALGLRESPQAQPAAVGKSRAATFYRFRTVHVGPDGTFQNRGGRTVLEQQLTEPALAAWANDMAAHLTARIRRAGPDGRISLAYLAASGRDEVQPAGITEQLVTAASLLRFAADFAFTPQAVKARDAAVALLESLAAHADADPASTPASAAAFVVAASLVADQSNPIKACFERCKGTLWGSFDTGKGFRESVPAPARGMVAWGLAVLARTTQVSTDLAAATSAVAAVYADSPPEKLPAQMPWLAFASIAAGGAEGPVPGGPALRDMRTLVWKHQLSSYDLEPHDQDLAGGIVFTSGAVRLPTWQTARPAAAISAMFAHPPLTDAAERGPEAARLLATLRFLRQLTADSLTCPLFPLPERAHGGVRAALWDQRMPPEATAITLLAVCDALRGFRAPPPGAGNAAPKP